MSILYIDIRAAVPKKSDFRSHYYIKRPIDSVKDIYVLDLLCVEIIRG